MRKIALLSAVTLIVVCYATQTFAYNTEGCQLHVDYKKFNYSNLTQLTWQATISEYDYIHSASDPFRLRIEINWVAFMGKSGTCTVYAMIQNVGHIFADDSADFSVPNFPALGLHHNSFAPTWPDSSHGVQLNVDPTIPPQFGRLFLNIDYTGFVGVCIDTRQNVGNPSPSNPIIVRWIVTKGDIVVNPQGNFSRSLNGEWVPLIGTFVKWNFTIVIDGISYNVADYYLPIEYAEYIKANDPLMFDQENFGAAEHILDGEKGTVTYTDMRASDGTNWYYLEDWVLTFCTDDGAGNLDLRYGIKSDTSSLTSSVGHETDITECTRAVGSTFKITPTETISTPNTPSGPTSGQIGVSYSYTAGGSSSSCSNPIEYQLDWTGDGSDLSPWGLTTQSNTWNVPGTYNVRARAECTTNPFVVSGWSSGLSVTISGPTISNRCDFNGDGKTDILWRNTTTGQNVVWFMNGAAFSSYSWIDTVTDTNWQIVGTGDFNGDGKTDILWRNKSTGQNIIWLMNGTTLSSYSWIDTVADTNWQIVGTGDFNGDGKTDILWRNKSTGQNVLWLMNGIALSSYSWIDTVADTNWQIVGTGDFNGDGKTDILWRNKSTGQNVLWLMNGTALSSYSWIDTVADTNWQIVGTGDFNGDGKTDILWRNKSTGQNVLWLMNGIALSSYSWIDTVADTNWEIVGPK